MSARDLLDEDGENLAVRAFLLLYGPGVTVGEMRDHMGRSGWSSFHPEWVRRSHPGSHLTKTVAQLWIRHLFALEGEA